MRNLKMLLFTIIIIGGFAGCSDDDCPITPSPTPGFDSLAAGLPNDRSIVLTWQAPAGAVEYDIRYTTVDIDETSWETATQVDNEPAPSAAGETEIFALDGLDEDTDYYVALKFLDADGAWSALSNVVTFYTSVFDARDKIVFQSDRDGDFEIYMINIDGTGLVQLTDNVVDESLPTWSPDADHILFKSNRGGSSQLYVMDARGRNAARVTDTTLNLQFPDYDPTGTRVYCRIESDAFNGIVSVNLGDGAISQVANFGTRPVFNFDVSLDGTKGAVSAALDDDIFSIYVFATSGPLGTERLTTDSTDSPRWSPDGTRLAFLATDGVTKDLTISNADGTDRTIIHSGSLGYLDWSPDGTRLLFTAPIAQDSNLFIINDDGTGLTQITDHSGRNMNGRWSPVQP